MVFDVLRAGRRSLIVCLSLLAATGCTPRTHRASVAGSVRLDGQPVESGSIAFAPTAGNRGPSAGAVIVDGRYSVDAAVGPVIGANLVELHSSRKTGRKVPTPMFPDRTTDEVIEAFPADYNTNSQLVRHITPGHNQIDFDLQSDARHADSP